VRTRQPDRHLCRAVPRDFRFILLIGACLMMTAVPTACRRASSPDEAISIDWQATPRDPIVAQEVTADIRIADAAGRDISGATVQIEAFMAHPGMAPIVQTTNETGSGGYRARLRLTMQGTWQLVASARFADGRSVRRPLGELHVRPSN